MEIDFKDCGYLLNRIANNFYMKLFHICLTQRPSCHACKFRFPNADSDITCGDAWGIKNFAPEMNDDKGASVVIIHTAKGQRFFDKANLKIKPIDFEVLKKYNPHALIPAAEDSRRKDFFAEIAESKDRVAVMKKYFSQDNKKITADNRKRNLKISDERYKKILAHFTDKPPRNVLVITKIWQAQFKDVFIKNFIRSDEKIGFMLASVHNLGDKNILRIFDSESMQLQREIILDNETILNFCDEFNVKNIFIIEPIQIDRQIILSALKNYTGTINLVQANKNQ